MATSVNVDVVDAGDLVEALDGGTLSGLPGLDIIEEGGGADGASGAPVDNSGDSRERRRGRERTRGRNRGDRNRHKNRYPGAEGDATMDPGGGDPSSPVHWSGRGSGRRGRKSDPTAERDGDMFMGLANSRRLRKDPPMEPPPPPHRTKHGIPITGMDAEDLEGLAGLEDLTEAELEAILADEGEMGAGGVGPDPVGDGEDDGFEDYDGFAGGDYRAPPGQRGSAMASQEGNMEKLRAEKTTLLNKLHRLKTQGVEVPEMSMQSHIDDIRLEHDRIVNTMACQNSIKFQRRALMAVVSGLEWGNGEFDPVGAQLDGWSETVMANITEYDSVFERLYERYMQGHEMHPMVELMMMVSGSALMFHMTSVMVKANVPSAREMQEMNPDMVSTMLRTMQAKVGAKDSGPVPVVGRMNPVGANPNATRGADPTQGQYVMNPPAAALSGLGGIRSAIPGGLGALASLARGPGDSREDGVAGATPVNLGSGLNSMDFQSLPGIENEFPTGYNPAAGDDAVSEATSVVSGDSSIPGATRRRGRKGKKDVVSLAV